MNASLARQRMPLDQNQQIADAIRRERGRLRAFIRRRVLDDGDAEDILQEVFYELVAAYRNLQPLEEVGAWLFRVARNRIIDLFRRRKPTVTVWQALGLLVMSRILFGGFHRHGGGHFAHWGRQRMRKHLAQMTPEEREKLHDRLHRHWGDGRAPE